MFKRVFKFVLPLVIIVTSLVIGKGIIDNPPAAKPRPRPVDAIVPIDAIRLQASDFQVIINSYGTVQPSLETSLIPQVSGKIIAVAANFENGGLINKGEMILKIDPVDYEIIIKTAAANLIQARATLAEEKARGQEALLDWKRLGRKGEPGDLVARRPQLSAARALVASARAQLEKSKLDLQRTTIRAPYSGRIKNKKVDLGQYVTPATLLTEIFASDSFKLRLPLAQSDLVWLQIPDADEKNGSEVIFTLADNDNSQLLSGTISRSEGVLDTRTRQLFITADINTLNQPKFKSHLAIGQFLKARIKGTVFSHVYPVAKSLLHEKNTVIVAEDNTVRKQSVNVVWQNEQIAVINRGLKDGDLLVTTPLGERLSKLQVEVNINNDKDQADTSTALEISNNSGQETN